MLPHLLEVGANARISKKEEKRCFGDFNCSKAMQVNGCLGHRWMSGLVGDFESLSVYAIYHRLFEVVRPIFISLVAAGL